MFDFLKRRGADGRGQAHRRRTRGPITIGFEQLEGREMLSASGIVLTFSPSGVPPLGPMPRPLVGRFEPEASGAFATSPKARPEPDRRGPWPWPIGGRFRFTLGDAGD